MDAVRECVGQQVSANKGSGHNSLSRQVNIVMMIWVGIEIVLSGVMLCIKSRVGFLLYQIGIAFAYLISLTMLQELDYTMSVYFAFALIPYIKYVRLSGLIPTLLAVYLSCATVVSFGLNGSFSVLSSIIIHFIGPLALPFVFANIPREIIVGNFASTMTTDKVVKAAIIAAVVGETIVGLMAISQSSDGRLMLNYQCVSGCLSCICLILVAILLERGQSIAFSYAASIYMVGWAIASGTRGYIILALVTFIVVFARNDNRHVLIITGLIVAAAICCAVALYWDQIVGFVMDQMRFGESTGRRTHENMWFMNLFASQGIFKDLFGVGIGTTYSSLPGAEAAWFGVGETLYTHQVVMGANFLHNFWFMSLLSIGIVGTALYIGTFIQFASSVRRAMPKWAYVLLLVFFFTYAVVLWFRWTATGGMLESAVLLAFIRFCSCGIKRRELR